MVLLVTEMLLLLPPGGNLAIVYYIFWKTDLKQTSCFARRNIKG